MIQSSCRCFTWKTPRTRTESCTMSGLHLGQKSSPPNGFYQTSWGDRKSWNSCRWKKGSGLKFLHEIVNNVEKFQIPSSLVLNLDQTNSKYVSMGKTTMAKGGSNSVPIFGLSDKRNMTAIFTITLNGKLLPKQLIYGEKSNQSLPKLSFLLHFQCLQILNTTVILQSPQSLLKK